MSFLWIVNPKSGLNISRSLSEKIDGAQLFISSVEDISKTGICHLCGKVEISNEHAPSKAAFNTRDLIIFKIAQPLQRFLSWSPEIQQGGNVTKTLCIECNNLSGAWYNTAYVKLARASSKYAHEDFAGKQVTLKCFTYPLRIVKQALIHIVSSSQSGLTEHVTVLRDFLKNKEQKLQNAPFRVGLYVRANRGARYSGLATIAKYQEERVEVLSEFSFWPLGWVIVFGDASLDGLYDVTSWMNLGYHDKQEMELSVPCHWAVQAYPKDFRSPQEVLAEDGKELKNKGAV